MITAPRSLIASEGSRSRTLAHLVLRLKNQNGILEAASLVSRHHVTILSGFHESSADSGTLWSFFVDMTDADVSADKLAEEFSRQPFVLNASIRANSLGFIADSFHFPIRMGSRPVVMFSVDAMKNVFQHLKSMLGPKVADVMIHQMGVSSGEGIYRGFELQFGKEATREQLEEFLHLVRATGWGCETLAELDSEASTARIKFANSVECPTNSSNSRAQSQFIRGTYSAFFSGFFGKPVEAEEVHCVAKGDAVCEFLLKPR